MSGNVQSCFSISVRLGKCVSICVADGGEMNAMPVHLALNVYALDYALKTVTQQNNGAKQQKLLFFFSLGPAVTFFYVFFCD